MIDFQLYLFIIVITLFLTLVFIKRRKIIILLQGMGLLMIGGLTMYNEGIWADIMNGRGNPVIFILFILAIIIYIGIIIRLNGDTNS